MRGLLRQARLARPERALHVDRVDPAPEFEADPGEHADLGEAQRRVQPDRGHRLAAANHRDHLAIALLGNPVDHLRQQRAADAAAELAGIDIDRVLDREAIAYASAVRPRVTIADDLAS